MAKNKWLGKEHKTKQNGQYFADRGYGESDQYAKQFGARMNKLHAYKTRNRIHLVVVNMCACHISFSNIPL